MGMPTFHIEKPGETSVKVQGRQAAVREAKKLSAGRGPSVVVKRDDDKLRMEFRRGEIVKYRAKV